MPAPDSGQAPHPAVPARRRRTRPPTTGKSKTDLAIDTAIDALIAKAPPLSAESRARLAELLSASVRLREM
ncbi:MAG: hypothetical protein ACRDJ9_14510 [Dehalococcoidia bacterium]